MNERLVHVLLSLARHRARVALATVFAVLVGLLGISHLRFTEDFRTMLPLSDPAIAAAFDAMRQTRQAERLMIDIGVAQEDPEILVAAAEAAAEAFGNLPEFEEFRGPLDPAVFDEAAEFVTGQLHELLAPEDLADLDPLLREDAIEQRLAWIRKSLSQSQGLALQPVIRRDPLGMAAPVWRRLQAFQGGLGAGQLRRGWVTSEDGRHILLSAVPRFPASDRGRGQSLMRRVLGIAREVERRFEPSQVRVAVTGAHRMALDNATMIMADTARIGVLATGTVALLLLGVFRRPSLVGIALLPTLAGAFGGAALLGWLDVEVSLVALGCGACLVGITEDYAIHLLYQVDHAAPRDARALAEAITAQAVPILVGATTTAGGFLIMALSPMSGHRQLGLFAATGVVVAALMSVFVLPLFLRAGASGSTARRPRFVLGLERFWGWVNRQGLRALVPAGILTLVAAAGITRLEFAADLGGLNGITPATRRDEDLIRQVWSRAVALTTVVVSGTNLDQVLADNERVQKNLARLQGEGIVEAFSSGAPFMPSSATRVRNRESWEDYWNAERRGTILETVRRAGDRLGYRSGVLESWLEEALARRTSSAQGADQFPAFLRDHWVRSEGVWHLLTPTKADGPVAFEALRQSVLASVPSARLLNRAALGNEMSRLAREGLMRYGVLVALVGLTLLTLWYGRIALAVVTLLPIATGVFWTLGWLGWLGLPVNVANVIFVVFVAGVTLDYSMFQVQARLATARGLPDRADAVGGAVTLCAATTLLAVGSLALARHPALQSIGITAWLGIVASMTASGLLVPSFMRWLILRRRPPGLEIATSWKDKRRVVSRRYDLHGPYVERFVRWKMRTDPVFRLLDEVVPSRGRCLDLGCGFGIAGHWLTLGHPERSVHGMDFDGFKIRTAVASAATCPRVTFQEGDLLHAEYPACDHVLMLDVLHYLPMDEKERVLARAWNAMCPGGTLVLREAMSEDSRAHRRVRIFERWAVWLGQNRTAHGLHFATRETYENLLRKTGFAEIQFRPDGGLGSNALLIARRGENLMPTNRTASSDR